ncbi:Zinc-finger domain of monoamine-oxidase A repressor R1 [Dillenia turbinata]|uniref:Zinc-finger domain of monoamine-oxidase A repressor R1 n=1 Tax=Dillenia turbinata TaxID=194707 RepID=A0AAN8V161_9MAGN
MVGRRRAKTLETQENPSQTPNNEEPQMLKKDQKSEYEETRAKRIQENLERMQKLGILDLSLKLKSSLAPKRTPRNSSDKTPQRSLLIPLSHPPRRSSRLQNVTPVSYTEVKALKKEKAQEFDDILVEEGFKPEIYTEEHEKLLGSCETTWTLFVDGYGKDGKRIYDPVRGLTCHQCRQKTLGHRTHCSQCRLVQGQFCGDCLYMRYGENVLEAKNNPNWICPVCRGICNCSLCRQAKGWLPTGSLYRRISSLGYKSVAHYLIQTHRSEADSGKDTANKTPVSAKRSLPFSEIRGLPESKEVSMTNDECRLPEPQADEKVDGELKGGNGKEMLCKDLMLEMELTIVADKKKGNVSKDDNAKESVGDNTVAPESGPMLERKLTTVAEPNPMPIESSIVDYKELERQDEKNLNSKPAHENVNNEKEMHCKDNEHGHIDVAAEGDMMLGKEHATVAEPSPQIIAERPSQDQNIESDIVNCGELEKKNDVNLNSEPAVTVVNRKRKRMIPSESSQECIARRLRSRKKST